MSINLEKIDLLKERANVGYKEAKEALEQCDGDLVEALIWLEENEKIKSNQGQQNKWKQAGRERPNRENRTENDFGKKVEDGVKSVHKMRFKIYKDDDTLLSLPATVAIIVGVFTLPMSLIALLAAVMFRYHIAVIKPDGETIIDDEKVKDAVKEEFQSEKPASQQNTGNVNDDPAPSEETFNEENSSESQN